MSFDLVIFLSSLMIMGSKMLTQSSLIVLSISGKTTSRLPTILLVLGTIMSGQLQNLENGGPVGIYASLLICRVPNPLDLYLLIDIEGLCTRV